MKRNIGDRPNRVQGRAAPRRGQAHPDASKISGDTHQQEAPLVIDRHVVRMPPKRKPDQTDDDARMEEPLPQQPQEGAQEKDNMIDYARLMVDEKREDRKRQRFFQQYVAPLRETEKYHGSQNARTFAAKWDAKMAGAAIPLKYRTEIFKMLLREYESTRMQEELDDAGIEEHDWLAAKQLFEVMFAPTTDNIVRNATALFHTR